MVCIFRNYADKYTLNNYCLKKFYTDKYARKNYCFQ